MNIRSLRPGALAPALAFLAILAQSSQVPALPMHGDERMEHDAEPPYDGPGYSGLPLQPDSRGKILDTFAASNVALLGWVPLSEFPGSQQRASDIWGYVSPSGREYAIIGLWEGVGFVEVTDPSNPVVVGVIPGRPSIWRDMKIDGEYAFAVHDYPDDNPPDTGDGLYVIDLTRIDEGQVSLAVQDTDYDLKTSHNIAVNHASHFVYLCGSNGYGPNISGGGLIAVDVSDPMHPYFSLDTVWSEHYVHDVNVVTYEDGPYAGREIAFAACGSNGLFTIDVTDKSAMVTLGSVAYPNTTYCHHSWLSPDRRLLYVNDELDELDDPDVSTTTTYVIDVSDLAHPTFLRSFTNGLSAIDHNPYGRDGYLYEANYRSGLRIYDIRNPGEEHEVGFFDTYPDNDNANFNGAWGVYPALPSGTILVSDIERGLFVLRNGLADAPGPEAGVARLDLNASPNPFRASTELSYTLPKSGPVRLELVDVEGRLVSTLLDRNETAGAHVVPLDTAAIFEDAPAGVYFGVLRTANGEAKRRLVLVR
ncbi:MAG: choice-of-anchor B family protein [Candidatus Eisenbacteria bacterium]|nr:choice-of-anchor B family protein [Candidatus Eisenbacteria bacterium]